MDATREIVDPIQVGHLLAGLSVLGLLAAGGLGLAARGGSLALRRGAILGAAAVLAYPLWIIYNGIEDHYGLDSVLALLLNAALFVVIGIVGGLVARRFWGTDPSDGEAAQT